MERQHRPLVLVHGLWNSSDVFLPLVNLLRKYDFPVFCPNLPHSLGQVPIPDLAYSLNKQINQQFGSKSPIDILGFSMGGLVTRYWLQKLEGARRTRRFFSVGCPHRGTFLAQCVPASLFAGIADMKRGSPLLNELNKDLTLISYLNLKSFFCYWDLMVIPGWQAALPIGPKKFICVLSHRGLVSHPTGIKTLLKEILIDDCLD